MKKLYIGCNMCGSPTLKVEEWKRFRLIPKKNIRTINLPKQNPKCNSFLLILTFICVSVSNNQLLNTASNKRRTYILIYLGSIRAILLFSSLLSPCSPSPNLLLSKEQLQSKIMTLNKIIKFMTKNKSGIIIRLCTAIEK